MPFLLDKQFRRVSSARSCFEETTTRGMSGKKQVGLGRELHPRVTDRTGLSGLGAKGRGKHLEEPRHGVPPHPLAPGTTGRMAC